MLIENKNRQVYKDMNQQNLENNLQNKISKALLEQQ